MCKRVLLRERHGGRSQQRALSNSGSHPQSKEMTLVDGNRRCTLFPPPLGETASRSSRLSSPSSLPASRLSAATANAPPRKFFLVRLGARCYTFVVECGILLYHRQFAVLVLFLRTQGGGRLRYKSVDGFPRSRPLLLVTNTFCTCTFCAC